MEFSIQFGIIPDGWSPRLNASKRFALYEGAENKIPITQVKTAK